MLHDYVNLRVPAWHVMGYFCWHWSPFSYFLSHSPFPYLFHPSPCSISWHPFSALAVLFCALGLPLWLALLSPHVVVWTPKGPCVFTSGPASRPPFAAFIPVSDYSCLLLHLTALRFVPSLSVLIGWCFVVPPLVIFLVVIERVTLSRHAQSYGGCRLFSGAFTQARWSPSVRSRSVMSHGGGYKGRLSQRHIAGSRGTATFIFLYQVCPISIFKSRFFSE